MPVLHSALGYLALLSLAWLAGQRPRQLPWKTLLAATLLQVGGTALLLLTGLRQHLFGLAQGLTDLLKATALKANESLLFIGVANPSFTQTYGPIVALEIAAILIFMAALSRLLYHYRILPWIVARMSLFMQRLMGLSAAESVSAAANVFLGMVEAPLFIRPYVARLTESELFCVMSAGLAGIAGTVLVVYASLLSPIDPEMAGHLFVASLISAPAAIAVAKIMIPETGNPETSGQYLELPADHTLNGLDAAAQGAAEGMQLFLNIAAMLVAFIGLVALGNTAVGALDGWINGAAAGSWSLQTAAGYLFRLPVWLMGIPWAETQAAGELMGIKTVLNEFVAYVELARRMHEAAPLSNRSFVILTYALCSFANFGSVAIMIGGIGGIAPERRGDLARLGLRSLLAGTLAAMLTGCVVGLFL